MHTISDLERLLDQLADQDLLVELTYLEPYNRDILAWTGEILNKGAVNENGDFRQYWFVFIARKNFRMPNGAAYRHINVGDYIAASLLNEKNSYYRHGGTVKFLEIHGKLHPIFYKKELAEQGNQLWLL